MRVVEKNLVNFIEYGFSGKEKNLSMRDRLENVNGVIKYYLWNTCLFTLDKASGKKRIFISSKGSSDYPISSTTKSRLNTILWWFNYDFICQKNFNLFYGSKEIKLDKWYILGTNKELIEE